MATLLARMDGGGTLTNSLSAYTNNTGGGDSSSTLPIASDTSALSLRATVVHLAVHLLEGGELLDGARRKKEMDDVLCLRRQTRRTWSPDDDELNWYDSLAMICAMDRELQEGASERRPGRRSHASGRAASADCAVAAKPHSPRRRSLSGVSRVTLNVFAGWRHILLASPADVAFKFAVLARITPTSLDIAWAPSPCTSGAANVHAHTFRSNVRQVVCLIVPVQPVATPHTDTYMRPLLHGLSLPTGGSRWRRKIPGKYIGPLA
ncbi:hypothetical protein GGX14DRAFT_578892 [Mycena pura]|uniref:Uncharacterized protein n=1 Tax=Mycena pura TaxID=153505 RepID=A0AAD6UP62_9AGAR|nr:hypothetical protein GGX14DRAFT_578892 [Mycena pura]